MSPRKLRTVAVFLLALSAVGVAGADSDEPREAQPLFARAERLMRQKDWFAASKLLEELAGRFPNSSNLDLYLFNKAKAHYYLGEFSEAIAGFSYFSLRFPSSPFIAHAHFFEGNAYYRRGNVSRAVASYLLALRLTDDQSLSDLAYASLGSAFKNAGAIGLSEEDLKDLPRDKKCLLVRTLADELLARNELKKAEDMLALCGETVDASRYGKVQLDSAREEIEVAVILPLSGELNRFADELFNGVTIAADFYREETGQRLKLTPYDTKGDPIDAARIAGKLSRSYTDLAIGPLTSEAAAVVSASLTCGTLPVIIPAATQAGLTALSQTSFQLSPNIELQGVMMANYARQNLGADSAAILTSTATDHLRMSRAFNERFTKLGGTIVAIEYFRSRDKDFGPYIRDIKAILNGVPSDSTYYIDENGDTLDLDVVPAFIDAIFLPGNPKQLRLLLPQVHFYNLNGAYLGSDGWGDETIYQMGDDITKGVVFPSPFLFTTNSPEQLRFAAAFDNRFGRRPERLASLGYDALSLALRAYRQGARSRESLVESLAGVNGYLGASGLISFGEHRENREMPLYRIQGQRAVPLEDLLSLPDTARAEP